MPLLTIKTNSDIKPGNRSRLLEELSEQVAILLEKPERYVMVVLESLQPMLFAGTDAPAAYLELKSIGLPTDQTKELANALCDLIFKAFAIPKDRIYIEFTATKRHMFGWNGSTFEH